ncbi:MAG TPA: hypothetical protein VEF72_30390 [Mycobacterium sp.]|nr:hypothetical protein [Mycobacterium sp.]
MIDLDNPQSVDEYRLQTLCVVTAHVYAVHDAVMDAGAALIVGDDHPSAAQWTKLLKPHP